MNINYGLFPAITGKMKKSERRLRLAERALDDLDRWKTSLPHNPERSSS
jgi:methylenetetrahydrofolate--tRNA-(uracil-5-)-methyltransferase